MEGALLMGYRRTRGDRRKSDNSRKITKKDKTLDNYDATESKSYPKRMYSVWS